MARGGARTGAGRKKSPIKEAPKADKCVATAILASIDEEKHWTDLIKETAPSKFRSNTVGAKDFAAVCTVHFNALRYLTDKRDGRPKQAIDLSGSVQVELADRLSRARARVAQQAT